MVNMNAAFKWFVKQFAAIITEPFLPLKLFVEFFKCERTTVFSLSGTAIMVIYLCLLRVFCIIFTSVLAAVIIIIVNMPCAGAFSLLFKIFIIPLSAIFTCLVDIIQTVSRTYSLLIYLQCVDYTFISDSSESERSACYLSILISPELLF